MNKKKKLELLLKARNILHKQESGEKLTGNEIIVAHDYVDMVLDAIVSEDFEAKWKPSDNELEALRLAAEKDGTCLMGLYEQLKKLKVSKIDFSLK